MIAKSAGNPCKSVAGLYRQRWHAAVCFILLNLLRFVKPENRQDFSPRCLFKILKEIFDRVKRVQREFERTVNET